MIREEKDMKLLRDIEVKIDDIQIIGESIKIIIAIFFSASNGKRV